MEGFPTRSVLLEKQDEQVVMREGFRFLDEKRLLLAAEALTQLNRFLALRQENATRLESITPLLQGAVARHGLEGLLAHPAPPLHTTRVQREERNFFGVRLVRATLTDCTLPPLDPPPCHPSAEARLTREAFHHLLASQAEQAAVAGNLRRLLAEYRRTELRARALEEVILPELERDVHEIALRLEEMEQEDAVRVRQGAARHPG